jgi:hypothetical protein
MTESGIPKRHNTFIDIPDSLRLPQFMLADEKKVEEDLDEFSTEYKLVLQSVVCHRGDSVQSGHYIAFARVAPKLLTENRRHDNDPPPDYEDAQWVRFDDLDVESRVSYVDDIKQSLKDEMPYLLFYQIVPMVDVASTEDTETEPPSYNESRVSIALPGGSETSESLLTNQTSSKDGYFDLATASRASKPPSIRFSTDMERPSTSSLGDDDPYGTSTRGGSRRASVSFTDSTLGTPAVTPDAVSPAATPGEETTAQRLSRAAARFTKSGRKSRPTSQIGEDRITATMTRLGGLMRPSKEPLRDSGNGLPVSSSTTLITSKDGEIITSDQPTDADTPKHAHKRGKAKIGHGDKDKGRSKDGVPPERECNVM